jgi:hypothetical protein
MIRLKSLLEGAKRRRVNEDIGPEISQLLFIAGGIVGSIALRALVKVFLQDVVFNASDIVQKIRDIVHPPKWQRFVTELSSNASFNKEFIDFLKRNGGMERARKGFNVAKVMVGLPSFKTAFNKFVLDEKMDKKNADMLRFHTENAFENAIRVNSGEMIRKLKHDYPELTQGLADGIVRRSFGLR